MATITPIFTAVDLARVAFRVWLLGRRCRADGRVDANRADMAVNLLARQLSLVLCLRVLGLRVRVPDERRGPQRAIADGDALLRPLGARVHRVPGATGLLRLPQGSYIVLIAGRFLALPLARDAWVLAPPDGAVFAVLRGRHLRKLERVERSLAMLHEGRARLRHRLGREAGLILWL